MTEDIKKVYKCLQDLTIAFYKVVHWSYSENCLPLVNFSVGAGNSNM